MQEKGLTPLILPNDTSLAPHLVDLPVTVVLVPVVDLSKEQASAVLQQAHKAVHNSRPTSGARNSFLTRQVPATASRRGGGIVISRGSGSPSASSEHDLVRDGHPFIGTSDIPMSHSSSSVTMNDLMRRWSRLYATPGSRFVSMLRLSALNRLIMEQSFILLSKAQRLCTRPH